MPNIARVLDFVPNGLDVHMVGRGGRTYQVGLTLCGEGKGPGRSKEANTKVGLRHIPTGLLPETLL